MIQSVEQRWSARIERARELQERHAPAAEILRFYGLVLEFQGSVARSSTTVLQRQAGLREQIDLEAALANLPELLSLVIRSGPALLAVKAEALQTSGESTWREILRTAPLTANSQVNEAGRFFARACVQPLAENLQLQIPAHENYHGNRCPACDGAPHASVLRPEGEGAQRWLLCSFCLREWLYRRLVCPACGEEDKDKLPHYAAEGPGQARVEACDSCKRYLKAIDLTVDGHAVPLVDEVAWSALDVWASQQGYSKIALNLMGF
jgi:FdhE protein